MWKTWRVVAFLPLLLASCGSLTVPAAVKMDSGEALIGTTTAAVSGGTFTVNNPSGSVGCSGTYDALDTRPTLSAPFRCSDGRYGTITVLRSPGGRGGSGTVLLADGGRGPVAFGDQASSVLQPSLTGTSELASLGAAGGFGMQPSTGSSSLASNSSVPVTYSTTYLPSYGGVSSGRVYTGNCPTPESLDAAGRRCGARSAASRPGGYDGYSSWASPRYSGGSTYVRGHYRNGHYVRGHYRRR